MNEKELIEALQPIRASVLAAAINTLFESGLYDLMEKRSLVNVREAAKELGLNEERTAGLLSYLTVEEILEHQENTFGLSKTGLSLKAARPWYTMLVGGYGNTYLQFTEALKKNSPPATRDGKYVAIGSGYIGHYDSNPVLKEFLETAKLAAGTLLDFGCGNGATLVDLCKQVPSLKAVGFEPTPAAVDAANSAIQAAHLSDRVTLRCESFETYMSQKDFIPADAAVFAFVLHEILGTHGREEVVRRLQAFRATHTEARLLIIEVDYRPLDLPFMRSHGLARAYYNPYYLLHPFTGQELQTLEFWRGVFSDAQYRIAAERSADPSIDSSELMHGFLLENGEGEL